MLSSRVQLTARTMCAGGLVVGAPLLGGGGIAGSGGGSRQPGGKRAAMRAMLAVADGLAIAWLLGQYAFQVRYTRIHHTFTHCEGPTAEHTRGSRSCRI